MAQSRIALVVPGIPKTSGGPGVSVAAMAGRLAESGWKPTILTTDQGISDGLVPIPANVDLKVFPLVGRWDRRLLRSPELIEWWNREGGRFDLVDIQGVWSFIAVDAAKACRERGVPYVMTPRGQASKWDIGKAPVRKGIFTRFWLSSAWKGASGYRFLSEEEKSASRLPAKEKGVVVPNWLEPTIQARALATEEMGGRLGIPHDAPTILFLGRLDPQKGVLELLDAFERLWREVPAAVLLLVGPGRNGYAARVRSKVASMTCSGNVRLPGPLYGAEKDAVLGGAAVLAMLSKSEGLPTVVLEALRAGVPVVVTAGANVPEVEGYEAGFVVRGAIEAARRLAEIVQDGAMRARMAENAKRLFRDRFSPENVFSKLLAFYRNVLDRSRRGNRSADAS